MTILDAPTLSASDKSAIIAELEKSAGGATGETIKNFLGALADNNRLSLLPGVCEKFGELMSGARGEVEMTVTSAQPLDNRTLSRLETAVAKSSYVGQGKKLKVTNTVWITRDTYLLGGRELTDRRSTQKSSEGWLLRLVTGPSTSVFHPRLQR